MSSNLLPGMPRTLRWMLLIPLGFAFLGVTQCPPVDNDDDGWTEEEGDCNDSNPAVNPGADEVCDDIDNNCDGQINEGLPLSSYYPDADGDGYGAMGPVKEDCQAPEGYTTVTGDCDDRDASINPDAEEVCDEKDNDCNGSIDDNAVGASEWWIDTDGDGYGAIRPATVACTAPAANYVSQTGDCNDQNAEVHPGAVEYCDDLDNDCDGFTDEDAVDKTTWYYDGDGDGYGVTRPTTRACDQPEGYAETAGDCDDTDPNANPGEREACDGVDNNCNGSIDEGLPKITSYPDVDGDGFGNDAGVMEACTVPSGYTREGGDCNDADPAVNPAAAEVCDGIDNDCDTIADEDDAVDAPTWYADADGDGYGVADPSVVACNQPDGYAAATGDCNDADSSTNPGAPEACDDLDNNCDGQADEGLQDVPWYKDNDGDGYGRRADGTVEDCAPPAGYAAEYGDCNNNDATIYPTAPELCDGKDNDCDSSVDEGIMSTWYKDNDGDGYGIPLGPVTDCKRPTGYAPQAGDCNDQDPAVHPEAPDICDGKDNDCDSAVDEDGDISWYLDADGDGYGTSDSVVVSCQPVAGHVTVDGDCDDENANVHPGVVDACDAIDNDCDGEVDEDGSTTAWYYDEDGDGYGVDDNVLFDCTPPEGYVAESGDCDDSDPSSYPDAPEQCDQIDNDCDDEVDEDVEMIRWYVDQDGDTYGSQDSVLLDCTTPEGYVANMDDCDDSDAATHPGADEYCDDMDNDCDNNVDEDAVDIVTWYADGDEDGFGNTDVTMKACDQLAGFVPGSGDCNDADASVFPGAPEVCNHVDDNCDGAVDDGLETFPWFEDLDQDGYGDAYGDPVMDCGQPDGFFAQDNTDCNDGEPDANPGAPEVCDTLDNDCDGAVDEGDVCVIPDGDGDGYTIQNGDCDDSNRNINPGATEICDGIDNDCDNLVDDNDSTVVGQATFYPDADNDGYGGSGVSIVACDQPAGYVLTASDCDDGDPGTNPAAQEVCDEADNDCDGAVDEGMQMITQYLDGDGDGFGGMDSIVSCAIEPGYALSGEDCDDTDADIYPFATELCDGVDNDCDGAVDEGFGGAGQGMMLDEDGDGFGGNVPAEGNCMPEGNAVRTRGDCDDTNDGVFPGATDTAGDGIDQDCGGTDGPEPHVGLGPTSKASIAEAIAAAQTGAVVWVGPGTYFETGLSFGGRNITLISTDLAVDTVINGGGTGPIFSFTQGTTASARLDGFTLTEGAALKGGAIYIENSSPTIAHCVLYDNFATDRGGAIFAKMSSSVITNTWMEGNSTDTAGKGGAVALDNAPVTIQYSTITSNSAFDGGGLYFYYADATLRNTIVSGNYAGNKGGAAYTDYASTKMFNSVFSGNEAVANGGAFFLSSKTPSFRNCLIIDNRTGSKGGAMHLYYSSPTIAQCVIARNFATSSVGGVNVYGGSSKPTIYNSIIAYNSSFNFYLGGGALASTISLTYTDLYNPTGDNHNVDPLGSSNFVVEPGFNGYADGQPNEFHLALSSPLVNVGLNTYPDVDGSVADLGIFGGTNGADWDLDADGYTNYFWPGLINDAPAGYSPMDYDHNDSDPAVQ